MPSQRCHGRKVNGYSYFMLLQDFSGKTITFLVPMPYMFLETKALLNSSPLRVLFVQSNLHPLYYEQTTLVFLSGQVFNQHLQ